MGALADIKRLYAKDPAKMLNTEYINPKVLVSPQVAFYSQKESMPVRQTAGRICGEFVMCYPPGIPILAPGEMITPEIIEYIVYACFTALNLILSVEGLQDSFIKTAVFR